MLKNINKKLVLVLYLILNNLFIVIDPVPLYATEGTYIVKDSEIEDFISELLAPILKIAKINPKSLNIYIIDDNVANSFVAGGQNIFINTGLITFASSYNEIAGVLSHELGHIMAGHLSRGSILNNNTKWLMLLGLAGFLLTAPFLGNSNNSQADIIGFLSYSTLQATQGAVLSYSRSEESQADQIALEYIKKTNYTPAGFYDFMHKLYNKEDKSIYKLPKYAMQITHPLTSSRMQFINDYITKHPKPYVEDKELSDKLIKIQAKIKAYNGEINNYPSKSIPFIYFQAIQSYAKADFLEAINLSKQLINKDPKDIYYKELLADSYFGNQSYDLAITYYNKIVRQVKSNKDLIYYKKALAYFAENKNIESLINTNLSIQINNKNPATWHLKSLILGKNGDIGGANLALAEKFLIMNNNKKAMFFAQNALQNLEKNSIDYIQTLDIINNINKK